MWRELGRPEASLIGVQYYRNADGEHRGPWGSCRAAARVAGWVAREHESSTEGSTFSSGGVESRPRRPGVDRDQVVVVAKIANLYGDGIDSHMTYYETARGRQGLRERAPSR